MAKGRIVLPDPIIHSCYHKVGTVWFLRIFRKLSWRYGLTFAKGQRGEADGSNGPLFVPSADLTLDQHSRLVFEDQMTFRGSHMIRDPRDVIVSGYRYHLWTEEDWVHKTQDHWGGVSYQEYLNSMSEEDGLIVELRRMARSQGERMAEWDYDDPRFFEIRYEEIIGNEPEVLTELLVHYGFPDGVLEEAVALADTASFHNVAARDVGAVEESSHLRSGRPGQWRDMFTDRVIEVARSELSDVLIATGYETSSDWGP